MSQPLLYLVDASPAYTNPIEFAHAFASATRYISAKPGPDCEGYLGVFRRIVENPPEDKNLRRLCELYSAEAISGYLCPESLAEKQQLEDFFSAMPN